MESFHSPLNDLLCVPPALQTLLTPTVPLHQFTSPCLLSSAPNLETFHVWEAQSNDSKLFVRSSKKTFCQQQQSINLRTKNHAQLHAEKVRPKTGFGRTSDPSSKLMITCIQQDFKRNCLELYEDHYYRQNVPSPRMLHIRQVF